MTGDISISPPKIVIIAGFEAFNLPLYRRAAAVVSQAVPSAPVQVFTDIDVESDPLTVEKALRNADVVLLSLIFDYNQVEWLRKGIQSGVYIATNVVIVCYVCMHVSYVVLVLYMFTIVLYYVLCYILMCMHCMCAST